MWAFRVAVLAGACVAAACGESAPRTVTETAQHNVTGDAAAASSPTTVVHRRPQHLRHGWGFDSPTGNIRCAIFTADHAELGCETLNNGRGVALRATGSGGHRLEDACAVYHSGTRTTFAGEGRRAYDLGCRGYG